MNFILKYKEKAVQNVPCILPNEFCPPTRPNLFASNPRMTRSPRHGLKAQLRSTIRLTSLALTYSLLISIATRAMHGLTFTIIIIVNKLFILITRKKIKKIKSVLF